MHLWAGLNANGGHWKYKPTMAPISEYGEPFNGNITILMYIYKYKIWPGWSLQRGLLAALA